MTGSSFGKILKLSTWGESHGDAIGCVLDGVPSGIKISKDEYDYFPYQRVLLRKSQKSLLSDIQNTIFSNLIMWIVPPRSK